MERIKTDTQHFFILLIVFILASLLLEQSPLVAGTTGKIMGVVSDQKTKEALIGSNIRLDGTTMGAASDLEGHYIVLNIAPGIYTLRATMIGYKELVIEDVRVSVDLTTEINFPLEPTVLEIGETVTIKAIRPMVVKDLTASTAVVGAEQISALPVTEISEALELQAGLVKDSGGGLHIRGGRSGEISYWIDGMPVTDVYDGGTVVDVNKNMVQELQVVSGAFNAEYGQAMSGIVNITTKEGSNKFGGSFTTYFGDNLSNHKSIFMNIDKINPVGIRNFEGSLDGPIIKDKLFFYLNGRSVYFDGWLYGQRRYNPNAVTTYANLPQDYLDTYAPEYANLGKAREDGSRDFQYILGSNANIDSLAVQFAMPEAIRGNPDSFSVYYNRYRENHKNGKGDGKYVSMNWNRKTYLQGKLIYRITPAIKLSYNYILDDVNYKDYAKDYRYDPDGTLKRFRTGQTHILQSTYSLNKSTFFKVGASYFTKSYKDYVYEDLYDSRYVHPNLSIQSAYSFKTGGVDDGRFDRETKTLLGKFDLESQFTKTHLIKTGIEVRRHKLFQEDITVRPAEGQTDVDLFWGSPYITTRVLPESTIYTSRYTHKPAEVSAYLQDKMEFKNMIVNFGLRFDYFDPDGVVLADESDPNIYNPIKPLNRYRDVGTDGVANTHDANGSEGNNIQEVGEPTVTLAERKAYWYKKATSKLEVSPRLGVSFPITERGVIHFSYGHFFQIPRFERLYQNPDFKLDSGTGNVGVIGNADLKPEMTINGEIGLQQQLSDDVSCSVTGFFRDIRDLAGTQAQEVVIFGGSSKYSKFVNSDFGFIRGVTFMLDKRFSSGLSATADYTFQLAKGSNSDPEQARKALAGGSLPEVQLTSLDWDQRHTINTTFSYDAPTWGGSLIAQWGSGLPYTPRRTEDIGTLLTNSQFKPSTAMVDVKAYKRIKVGIGSFTLFVRIFNLLDALNEINVYDDTGRAGVTTDEQTARATNPPEAINTLKDWFTDPTQYSEPRRVEMGLSYDF